MFKSLLPTRRVNKLRTIPDRIRLTLKMELFTAKKYRKKYIEFKGLLWDGSDECCELIGNADYIRALRIRDQLWIERKQLSKLLNRTSIKLRNDQSLRRLS